MLSVRSLLRFPCRLSQPGRTTLPRHSPLLCNVYSTQTFASVRTITEPVNTTTDRSLPINLPVPTIHRVLTTRQ
ncbi:hypothetical protein IWQ61_001027, partial [Dispira simplex]